MNPYLSDTFDILRMSTHQARLSLLLVAVVVVVVVAAFHDCNCSIISGSRVCDWMCMIWLCMAMEFGTILNFTVGDGIFVVPGAAGRTKTSALDLYRLSQPLDYKR